MSDQPTDSPRVNPPTPAVALLVDELGVESTRELVQIYLREFNRLHAELSSGDRTRQHFAAHSLKSSAFHMGAAGLGELMARLEEQLNDPNGAPLTAGDIANVVAEFGVTAGALRAFVQG